MQSRCTGHANRCDAGSVADVTETSGLGRLASTLASTNGARQPPNRISARSRRVPTRSWTAANELAWHVKVDSSAGPDGWRRRRLYNAAGPSASVSSCGPALEWSTRCSLKLRRLRRGIDRRSRRTSPSSPPWAKWGVSICRSVAAAPYSDTDLAIVVKSASKPPVAVDLRRRCQRREAASSDLPVEIWVHRNGGSLTMSECGAVVLISPRSSEDVRRLKSRSPTARTAGAL